MDVQLAPEMTLPSPVFVTEGEYLRTSYQPDRELINGELRGKPMPTRLHGIVQMMIGIWFGMHLQEWHVSPESEVRTRVRPGSFRLPDVNVVTFPAQLTETQDAPPLIAIEILSNDDRVSDLQKRAGDLHAMGVENIWLVDPEQRLASIWTDGLYWKPEARPSVPGTAIYLDLPWLWSQVDLVTGKG